MAEWNDTRFQREDFGKLIPAAHGELDEGGVIVPMFNDSIGATNDKVGGWIDDSNDELTGATARFVKRKSRRPWTRLSGIRQLLGLSNARTCKRRAMPTLSGGAATACHRRQYPLRYRCSGRASCAACRLQRHARR